MVDPERLEFEEGYARFRPVGAVTVTRLLPMLREVMMACQERHVTRLVMDGRMLDHKTLTLADRLRMATALALFWDRGIKFAIVGRTDQFDPEQFDTLVTRNRGLPIGFYASESEALSWLFESPDVS